MWLVRVVIRRYIDILIIIINFPYYTCIRSFFGSSILTSMFIFKCFFGLVSVMYCIVSYSAVYMYCIVSYSAVYMYCIVSYSAVYMYCIVSYSAVHMYCIVSYSESR